MIIIRLKILQINFNSLNFLILQLPPPSCRESEESLRIWLGGKMASKLSMSLHSFQKSPGKEFKKSWQMSIGHFQICDCFPAPFPLQFHNVSISWASAALSELFRYVSSCLRRKSYICSILLHPVPMFPQSSFDLEILWKLVHHLRPYILLHLDSAFDIMTLISFESETDPEKWYITQPNWVPAFHEAVFGVLTHLLEKSIKLPSRVRLKFTRVLNEWNDPNS